MSVALAPAPSAPFAMNRVVHHLDRLRVHLHLLRAELRLRCLRPVPTVAIAALRAYRRAGEYPSAPPEVPGYTPVFLDPLGPRCAVAALMYATNDGALAERVAARENLARVGEMRTDGVREWAARVGLTPDDLACIQPTYPCPADTAQIVTLTTLALTLLAAFGCAGNGARLLWRAFRSHSGAVVPMLWWLAGVVGVPMLTVAIGAHGTPPMCLPLPIATLLLAAGVYGTYTLFLLSAPLLIAVGVRARLRRT